MQFVAFGMKCGHRIVTRREHLQVATHYVHGCLDCIVRSLGGLTRCSHVNSAKIKAEHEAKRSLVVRRYGLHSPGSTPNSLADKHTLPFDTGG